MFKKLFLNGKMQKFTAILTALSIFVFSVYAAPNAYGAFWRVGNGGGEDILNDGGLEYWNDSGTDLTNWTKGEIQGEESLERESSTVYNPNYSTYSAKFTNDASGNGEYIYQTISGLTLNDTYRLSLWAKTNNTDTGSFQIIFLDNNVDAATQIWSFAENNGGWKTWSGPGSEQTDQMHIISLLGYWKKYIVPDVKVPASRTLTVVVISNGSSATNYLDELKLNHVIATEWSAPDNPDEFTFGYGYGFNFDNNEPIYGFGYGYGYGYGYTSPVTGRAWNDDDAVSVEEGSTNLFNNGYILVVDESGEGDLSTATQFYFVREVTFTNGSAAITIPKGTSATVSGGYVSDLGTSTIDATPSATFDLTGYSSAGSLSFESFENEGNLALTFDPNISVTIPVAKIGGGDIADGTELNIYSKTGNDSWTADSGVTCTVGTDGLCTFNITHASTYAAVMQDPSTPTASPSAGSYTSTQSVTLSSTNSSSIRYSTSSTPADCSSGTQYSGPISISSTTTLYVRACNAIGASSVASFTYTISSGGGGSGIIGGGGGSSSNTYQLPTAPSNSPVNTTKTIQLPNTGEIVRPVVLSSASGDVSLNIPKDTKVTDENGKPYTGTIDPPKVLSLANLPAPVPFGNKAIYVVSVDTEKPIKFSKKIKITIPVVGNVKAEDAVVYYYDTKAKQYVFLGGKPTADGKSIEVEVDHLTTFVVMTKDVTKITFSDLPSNHWAAAYVKTLVEKGVIKGRGEGKYEPSGLLTRAEMVKIALLAFGKTVPASVNAAPFKDVSKTAWYATYVAAAKDLGLVSGYNDGTFKPGAVVTRAEALKILLAASGLTLDTDSTVSFKDIDSAAWYMKYLKFGVKNNVVSGYADNTFKPNASVNRAEIAKIAVKAMELVK